jgi:hypothetical protein
MLDRPLRQKQGKHGEVTPTVYQAYAPRVRDIETIDSELRLLLAIRQMVREEEGRVPSTRHIDQVLDERAAAGRQG